MVVLAQVYRQQAIKLCTVFVYVADDLAGLQAISGKLRAIELVKQLYLVMLHCNKLHDICVDVLNRCNTFSFESQLQIQRLRWLGHVFRMSTDRMPKKLLFGQVKGQHLRGCPRSSFNDVVLRDCQQCHINRPFRDAQDRLLWKDKTCPART